MTRPPYEAGGYAAYFDPAPEGIRVHKVAVLGIEQTGDNWRVDTSVGSFEVNAAGEATVLVPVDHELTQEFASKGDVFVAESTVEPDAAELALIEEELNRLDVADQQMPGQGYER